MLLGCVGNAESTATPPAATLTLELPFRTPAPDERLLERLDAIEDRLDELLGVPGSGYFSEGGSTDRLGRLADQVDRLAKDISDLRALVELELGR